jgi:hypothetical protein
VDEIDEVDRIYFGNIEISLRDDISYSDLNDEDDEDCESDKENIDSSTSLMVISVISRVISVKIR